MPLYINRSANVAVLMGQLPCKISAAGVYNRAMLQSAFSTVGRDTRRFGLQATSC